MSRRVAMLIGTSDYSADPALRKLVAPATDTQRLAHLLEDPVIGGFEVRVLSNQPAALAREAIEETLVDCHRDDLVLLYFTGHGVKGFHDGHLYLALVNTRLKLLESTAISSDFINKVMLRSRSRQQVLILDCCYSGAFARGMTVKAGEVINTAEHFPGQGRAILTASDAMQYALEGEIATGAGIQSVFTRVLADGLETGEADLDGDGRVDLEELYEYTLRRMADEAPTQRPSKVFALSGKLYLAYNPHPLAPRPMALPPSTPILAASASTHSRGTLAEAHKLAYEVATASNFSREAHDGQTPPFAATVKITPANVDRIQEQNCEDSWPKGRPLHSVSFSRDGKYLLSIAGKDAFLCEAEAGTPIRSFSDAADIITAAISANDMIFATVTGVIRLWRVGDGKLIRTIEDVKDVLTIGFSPDSRMLASTSRRCTKLWNLNDGELINTVQHIDQSDETNGWLSPDASLVAMKSTTKSHIRTRNDTYEIQIVKVTGETVTSRDCISCPLDVAFSSDNSLMAVAYSNSRVAIYRLKDTERQVELEVTGQGPLAFSSDGMLLATFGINAVQIWQTTKGVLKRTIKLGQIRRTQDATRTTVQDKLNFAFSPRGDLFVLITHSTKESTIARWGVPPL